MGKIIQLQQGTPEWLAWRREGITATDIAAILGVSPYGDYKDIIKKKQGLDNFKKTPAMERGTFYEEEALEIASSNFGCHFKPVCIESDVNSLFRASLDGFADETVLEIKTPLSKNFKSFLKKPANLSLYTWQVKWQMMVSSAKEGYLFVFHPETTEFDILPIQLSSQEENVMKSFAQAFWDSYIFGWEFEVDTKKVDYLFV